MLALAGGGTTELAVLAVDRQRHHLHEPVAAAVVDDVVVAPTEPDDVDRLAAYVD